MKYIVQVPLASVQAESWALIAIPQQGNGWCHLRHRQGDFGCVNVVCVG